MHPPSNQTPWDAKPLQAKRDEFVLGFSESGSPPWQGRRILFTNGGQWRGPLAGSIGSRHFVREDREAFALPALGRPNLSNLPIHSSRPLNLKLPFPSSPNIFLPHPFGRRSFNPSPLLSLVIGKLSPSKCSPETPWYVVSYTHVPLCLLAAKSATRRHPRSPKHEKNQQHQIAAAGISVALHDARLSDLRRAATVICHASTHARDTDKQSSTTRD